jgi:hypothetical protein
MITYTRTDEIVNIKIQTGILGTYYELSIKCSGELHAELLLRQLNIEMQNQLRKIREEAYLDGYKDGRAKRGKKNWFKSWW